MLNLENLPHYSYKMLSRFFILATLAGMGIFLDFVPKINLDTYDLSFQSVAYADDFSDNKIEKYARAALKLEQKRLQVYRQIISNTGTPPSFACYQQASFNNLSQQARSIADRFCNESEQIVRNSGLSVQEFNEITRRKRSDPNLERRIQELIDRM